MCRRAGARVGDDKARDGQAANRAFYAAVGVGLEGDGDVLGIWVPPAAEGARHWPSVLAELKNRGVRDVFFPVRDGLKGLPDAVGVVWPEAVVQMCIIHLMRNTFRHASKADWGAIGYDPTPIHTAVGERSAEAARDETLGRRADKHPAIRGPVDRRVGEVHAVPRPRRGDPQGHPLDQRDREPQRASPPLGQGAGPLPRRAGRAQTPLPDRAFTGPDRQGAGKKGGTMETRVERVRHHLRRPLAGRQEQLTMKNCQSHT